MSLTLDDLVGRCDDCGGTGKKPAEESGSGSSYGRRVVRYTMNSNPDECGRCAGTGRRGLTETGHAIVQLLGVVDDYKAKKRLGAHWGGRR